MKLFCVLSILLVAAFVHPTEGRRTATRMSEKLFLRMKQKQKAALMTIGLSNAKTAVANLAGQSGSAATDMRFAFRGFISSRLPGAKKLCSGWCGSTNPSKCTADPTYGDTVAFAVPGGRLISFSTRRHCARTDNRHYKTQWHATSPNTNTARINHFVQWEGGRITAPAPKCGNTIFYVCEQASLFASRRAKCGARTCNKACSNAAMKTDNFHCLTGGTWASLGTGTTCNGDAVLFHIVGKARDPCTPPGTPYINWEGWGGMVKKNGKVWSNIMVDDFPWFEVNGYKKSGSSWTAKNVARLDPEPGKGLFSLFGGANRALSGVASF